MRSSAPLTLLDTAGLVSDTYKRLAQQQGLKLESRAQFLSYCSRIMRSVVIDLVRERNAKRRGGGAQKITLNTVIGEAIAAEDEPLRVDEALADLAKVEPRLAQVVEMRYFGGYDEQEVAEALGITTRTVQRDWQKARVLLQAIGLQRVTSPAPLILPQAVERVKTADRSYLPVKQKPVLARHKEAVWRPTESPSQSTALKR